MCISRDDNCAITMCFPRQLPTTARKLITTICFRCKKWIFSDTCVIRVVLSVSYLLVSYFVMNFLRRIFSVCHSFQSMRQSGRMKGLERCFKVEDQGTWHRENLHAAILRPYAKRIQIKLYEPHLGKEKPVMGNIEPLLGITKPADGLNKPCQGNVNGRKSFAAEGFNVKILFISLTYTKAVAISFRQSLVKYHPRVVFTESFHAMVSTDEEVCSPCERVFDRHCKVQQKRHRDREPSRLLIKKIMSSMKKRKARPKLKRIFRKSTPKSSSLYKLATDYKLWYVTYVHRCDCFFTNFANPKRWAANK